MHPIPGTYTLILSSSVDEPIDIGKLGTLAVHPGYYVYIGSAFGPGGLKARIQHHLKQSDRLHWHIDYLSPTLRLREVWYTYDQTRREHQWAEVHSRTRSAQTPLAGFGSSDCRCKSHLFYYKSKPSGQYFRRKVRAIFNDHARFMIKSTAPGFFASGKKLLGQHSGIFVDN